MKSALKKIVPKPVWQAARKTWLHSVSLAQRIGPQIRSMKYCGLTLFYNSGNGVIRRLKNEPIFEVEMCQSIVKELEQADAPVFLDIGANIGLISSYVLAKVPNVKIHAFEPGPTQRKFLTMTIEKNGLSEKVKIYPEALGREIGVTTFYVHDEKEMAKDSLADTGRAGRVRPVQVNINTLDAWWKSIGRPKIQAVKIDTEGAELWVLEGGKEFLKASKPIIFMEIEPLNLRAFPYSQFDILKYIEGQGFMLATLAGEKANAANIDQLIKKGNDTFVARAV